MQPSRNAVVLFVSATLLIFAAAARADTLEPRVATVRPTIDLMRADIQHEKAAQFFQIEDQINAALDLRLTYPLPIIRQERPRKRGARKPLLNAKSQTMKPRTEP
jgi:hypothetical protein